MLINVPEEIYHQLQDVAQATALPLEQVAADRLKFALWQEAGIPPDEQTELDALSYLADDTLWMLAAEQLPNSLQERMQALMDKNNFGTISTAEYQELAGYVERGNRLMLRKAEAAAILTRRGHSVTKFSE